MGQGCECVCFDSESVSNGTRSGQPSPDLAEHGPGWSSRGGIVFVDPYSCAGLSNMANVSNVGKPKLSTEFPRSCAAVSNLSNMANLFRRLAPEIGVIGHLVR